MKVGTVVQFNENHKWCGSFGYIARIDEVMGDFFIDSGKLQKFMRYQVAVPIPEKGTAYIFVMSIENALDIIGETDLMLRVGDDDGE